MTKYVFEVKESLNSPAEEAYRVLKTNIQFCAFDRRIKTLAIVSPDHVDGKTTTAINLAISMTKAGIRVLLIDSDMRKMTMYKHFAGNFVKGLADVIAGDIDFDEAVASTSVKNFFILTAGTKPPYPTEFLTSNAFNTILEKSKVQYDFVIIDTPAMCSYIDAAVIASRCDGTVIVVKSKNTTFKSAHRVSEQLEKVNARVLGVILNKVKKSEYRNYYNTNYSYSNLKKMVNSWKPIDTQKK